MSKLDLGQHVSIWGTFAASLSSNLNDMLVGGALGRDVWDYAHASLVGSLYEGINQGFKNSLRGAL